MAAELEDLRANWDRDGSAVTSLSNYRPIIVQTPLTSDAPQRHRKPRRQPQGSSRGFSLIELLVAILIFAVVALAISGSTLQAARQNRVSEAQAVATSIAQSVLECLRLERVNGLLASINCETSNERPGYDVQPPTVTTVSPGVQWDVVVTWTAAPAGSVRMSTLSR